MIAPLSPENIDNESPAPSLIATTEAFAGLGEELETSETEINARQNLVQDYATRQAEAQNNQPFSPTDFSRMVILLGGIDLILIGRALSHPNFFNWLLAVGVAAAFVGAVVKQQRSKARPPLKINESTNLRMDE